MELSLKRPLLFFDIESTGLNIATDAIVELCFVKVFPGPEVEGVNPQVWTKRIRPWDLEHNRVIPMTPGASEVNHIKDEASTQPSSTCRCSPRNSNGPAPTAPAGWPS